MVFQGLDQQQADDVWQPFFEWVRAAPDDFRFASRPARGRAARRGDSGTPAFLKSMPGIVVADDRPGAPEGNVFWAGDAGQVGQFLHGYQSAWLPAVTAGAARTGARSSTRCSRRAAHWGVSLHVNKGLAGAPAEDVAAARDTATNPDVLSAFALLISGAAGPPAYPGVAGHEPDLAARTPARRGDRQRDGVRCARWRPTAGSYVSEANFFEPDWAARLLGRRTTRDCSR